jgi:hypothetical protein
MSCDPFSFAGRPSFKSECDDGIALIVPPEQKVCFAVFLRTSKLTHLPNTLDRRTLSQRPLGNAIEKVVPLCRTISTCAQMSRR